MSTPTWSKDPADIDWFQFDWSNWLAVGETIASATVTTDSLTILATQIQSALVLFNVSGGTIGGAASVVCEIVTSEGNTYSTTKSIFVRTRIS